MTLHLSRLRRRRNQLICESTHNYTNLLTHTVASKCIRFVVVHLRSHLARTQPECVCSLSLSLCLSLSLFLSFPLIVKTRQTSSFAFGTRVEQTCLKPDL